MAQFITVIICVIDFNVLGEELNKHQHFRSNPNDCVKLYTMNYMLTKTK